MNATGSALGAVLTLAVLGASDEPVGHWKLDEASGVTVSDSSARGHSGKLEKGDTWVEGRSGKAVALDGQDDFVRIARTAALESTAVTVALWIKRNGAQSSWATLVKKTWKNNSAPTYGSWGLQLNPRGEGSDKVAFVTGAAPGTHFITSQAEAVPDGTWVHVAGVYDPAGQTPKKRLFVNGALVASADEDRPMLYDATPTGDLYFGQSGAGAEYFKGALDDIRVYPRALSDAQVKALCPGVEPPKAPAAAGAPAAGSAPAAAKRGAFRTAFNDRSPLHTMEAHALRFGNDVRKYSRSLDYDVAKETFEVNVPGNYDASTPFGLFIWINSVDQGSTPPEWQAVFEKHRMISIGANKAGNDRYVWVRVGLAIEAAHNMKKLYAIDEERVYVGGLSGGSHCACDTAIDYADLFQGGFYFCAAHPRKYKHTVVDTAKKRSRFVFCTGENDNLRASVIGTHKDYVQDGYAHTVLFDIPGMGHTTPNAEWFEKGIVFLDSPLKAAAPVAFSSAQKAEKAGKLREALAGYLKAASHGRGEKFEAEAREKGKDLRARLEATSREAFAKLSAGKPSAQRLKDFAKEWAGYEGGAKAAEEANRFGEEELGKLGTRTGNALRQALQKFMKDWEAYPVTAKALETLDREAGPEFDKIREVTPDKARHGKLMDFGVLWLPSTVARKALETVESEIRPALEDIKALKTDQEKLPKLLALARDYKEVPAGKEAKALAEGILSQPKK